MPSGCSKDFKELLLLIIPVLILYRKLEIKPCTPVMSTLKRMRQEDHEFETSLDYKQNCKGKKKTNKQKRKLYPEREMLLCMLGFVGRCAGAHLPSRHLSRVQGIRSSQSSSSVGKPESRLGCMEQVSATPARKIQPDGTQ